MKPCRKYSHKANTEIAGILESKALDIVVGYGRVKGGVSGLWEKEQAEYDQKEQLYADLLKKHPMKYDAKTDFF